MLGKLKEMAGNSILQSVINQVTPIMIEYVEKIKALSPEKIHDDEFFDKTISTPAWLAISASVGGLIALYPSLETKFPQAMRHLRNELIVVTEGKVTLIEGFQAKLPQVVMDGLKG